MTRAAEALFALIRSAFGEGENSSIVSSLRRLSAEDWNKLIDLAFEQGVAAISVDGLGCMVDGSDLLDSPELEDLKYEWFGSVFPAETDFAGYLSAAKSLASLYADNGVKTLVLKGLVFSECYPNPSHRSSCDLDCYLASDYEKGNRLVEQAGVTVDRDYFKNSSFCFEGLHVENHHFFTAFRGSRKAKRYERLLHQEIESGETSRIFDSDLLAPPVMFSTLFCISHAQEHFLTEEITLRHILDWALFRKRHYDEIVIIENESIIGQYDEDVLMLMYDDVVIRKKSELANGDFTVQ